MQILEDFWAFNFELTNSHLFQCQLYTALTSLWHNFSGIVFFANSNLNCLLINNFCFRSSLQPTAARRMSGRFSKMHGAVRALHVSPNNASIYTRTVRKWLTRNNGHLITLQIWISWKYHGSDARRYFETFRSPRQWTVALEKMWDNFPYTNPIKKLSRLLEIVWQSTWRVMEDILNLFSTQKVFTKINSVHCFE